MAAPPHCRPPPAAAAPRTLLATGSLQERPGKGREGGEAKRANRCSEGRRQCAYGGRVGILTPRETKEMETGRGGSAAAELCGVTRPTGEGGIRPGEGGQESVIPSTVPPYRPTPRIKLVGIIFFLTFFYSKTHKIWISRTYSFRSRMCMYSSVTIGYLNEEQDLNERFWYYTSLSLVNKALVLQDKVTLSCIKGWFVVAQLSYAEIIF